MSDALRQQTERTDEFGWTDADAAHGRVIGYREVRLEQDPPDDVVALLEVGRKDGGGTIIAEPIYLTGEQAIEVALMLLGAAGLGEAMAHPDEGPVGFRDQDVRDRLHCLAASINDFTFWVQHDEERGYQALEVETGISGTWQATPEAALRAYWNRDYDK